MCLDALDALTKKLHSLIDALWKTSRLESGVIALRPEPGALQDGLSSAVSQLEPRNEIGRCLFTKEPEPLRRDSTYRYTHSVVDLLRALDTIAERSQRQLPPPTAKIKGIVAKEPNPDTRKAGEVLRQMDLRGVARL